MLPSICNTAISLHYNWKTDIILIHELLSLRAIEFKHGRGEEHLLAFHTTSTFLSLVVTLLYIHKSQFDAYCLYLIQQKYL